MENNDGTQTYNPDANYDEAIMFQQREIEKEISESQALIGKEEALSCLAKEYSADDAVYQQKLQELQKKYKCLRKVRGDGNCFYRGFGFAYFETLLKDQEEFKRFRDVAAKSKDDLISLGFPQFTLEDFHDTFMDVVDKVGSGCSFEDLLETFNDQGLSDYLVVYFRLLVSGHLQKEHEFFQCFIEDGRSVKEFCGQEVEPMAKESDHIHVSALTASLGVSVTIEYMDRGAGNGTTTHDFLQDSKTKVTLLYRPGHYDILYSK